MKWKFPASSAADLLHHCQLQLLFKIQMKITRPHFEIMSVTNSWAINNLHYFTILCALWCVIMIVILHHLRRSQSAPWSLKKDNSWRSAATGKKIFDLKVCIFPRRFFDGSWKTIFHELQLLLMWQKNRENATQTCPVSLIQTVICIHNNFFLHESAIW